MTGDELEDGAAFAQLWDGLVRVAQSVLGSRTEAEECASAALLQVLERGTRSADDLEALLVTITRRRAVDRLRAQVRGRRRDARLAARALVTEPDPSDRVTDRAAASWLADEAEARLNPQAMRVLRAVADGHSLRDVAAREQLSVRAVESVLFRARKAMQSVWWRASVALAAVAGGVRRSAALSTPVVLAAAAVAVMQLPAVTSAPGLAEGDPVVVVVTTPPHVLAHPVARAPRVTAQGPADERQAVATVRAAASPTPRETDVGPVKVTDERHGSGPARGPVGGALECAQNVNLDPKAGPLGC